MDRLKFWVRKTPTASLNPTTPRQDGHPSAGPNPVIQERIIIQRDPQGTSGTRNFSGYFSEDYFSQELHGIQAADQFDKMRRGDSVIKMVTKSVKNPILGATWELEPGEDTDEMKRQRDLIQHILFCDMDKGWKQHVAEALSLLEFGYSLFEITHKAVLNHPVFGSYNGIKALGFRSQRSIESWHLDHDTGHINYVRQLAIGDLQSNAEIPGEFLLPMTLDREGDNYEGISGLRSCYGAWKRKQLYLKLLAIGIERTAVPCLKATVPEGKQNSVEYSNLVTALANLTSNERGYLTVPQGWEVDTLENNFDPEKVKIAIEFEDGQIVKSFLANFLLLGQTGQGSQALSMDQSQFFLSAIQTVADVIADAHNHYTIPALIKMNFGPQLKYPKLKCTGLSDKAGAELATALKDLAQAQVIRPDDELEEHIRRRYSLSPRSDKGVRLVKPPGEMAPPTNVAVENGDNPDDPAAKEVPEKEPKLKVVAGERPRGFVMGGKTTREKIKKTKAFMGEASEELRELMQTELSDIAENYVRDIMAAYRRLPDSQRLDAVKKVSPRGVQVYRDALKEALTGFSTKAIAGARAEVPGKSGVALTSFEKGVSLGEFERLPKKTQRKIQSQTELLVGTQLADIEKFLFFQYVHSVDSISGNEALLQQDLFDAAENYVEGASVSAAAGNTASVIINEARNAFFFDDQVLEGVASFTFTNNDPVSEICQDLNGSVFEADDPEAERYFPPLHHNCKSFLVPNLKGADEPDITGLKPSSKDLEKFITL